MNIDSKPHTNNPFKNLMRKMARPTTASFDSDQPMNDLFAAPLPYPKSITKPKLQPSFSDPLNVLRKDQSSDIEELTVVNLRKLYSSLLEEIAPVHHALGTGHNAGDANSNWRWKNHGTITVNGSDDDGYDYAYTPDDSKKSWRLQHTRPGVAKGGVGITGGDWSQDGIRRYHTGGSTVKGNESSAKVSTKSRILTLGDIDVDISTMDGISISPEKIQKSSVNDNYADDVFLMDQNSIDSQHHVKQDTTNDKNLVAKVHPSDDENMYDVDITNSTSILEESLKFPDVCDEISASIGKECSQFDNALSSVDKTIITAFESLYYLSPTMAWRIRSAYAPTSSQEQHLLLLSSEGLAHRHPEKADGMIKGLEVAKNCEIRICDGLWRVGKLICMCERMKTQTFISKENHDTKKTSCLDEDDIESAEAVFAYFCEKNIFPMLVDAFLCQPPTLSSQTLDKCVSPFSGATWTSAVKSQILLATSMLIFNTTSPLSLTYLLSNNYMNELIIGMLPLEKWKEEALEEMLPPYVTLLRGLVMKLRGDEGQYCAPLLICQRQKEIAKEINDCYLESEAYMPLLYGAVQVLVSNLGSALCDSDGYLIRTTSMNVILNLCRITDQEVRDVLVSGSNTKNESFLPTSSSISQIQSLIKTTKVFPMSFLTIEQQLLFQHICKSLTSCYHRSVRLLMASLSLRSKQNNSNKRRMYEHHLASLCDLSPKEEAASRHKDIASGLLSELRYWLGFVDDLLSCGISQWNFCLCECIMREVIVGTILLNWNQSIEALKQYTIKTSMELKAKAEIRTSVSFITQFFSMVEYPPLIKMLSIAVFHEKYPDMWCKVQSKEFSNNHDLFMVTSTLNYMVRRKKMDTACGDSCSLKNKEGEADAGAGGECSNPTLHDDSDSLNSCNTHQRYQNQKSMEFKEINHVSLEADSAQLHHCDALECVDQSRSKTLSNGFKKDIHYIENIHRISLLKMLEGDSHPVEETILASMLLASLLETGIIDDDMLETLGLIPLSQSSAFENAIAGFLLSALTLHNSDEDNPRQKLLCTAIECTSSLGMMLLERIIYHKWTEKGQHLDESLLNYYFYSSKFFQVLRQSLSYFSLYTLKLSKQESISYLFPRFIESEIRLRYSRTNPETAQHQHFDEKTPVVCCLTNYNPSNLIDNSYLLMNETVCPDASDLIASNSSVEAVKFSINLTLHFRSLVLCVDEYHRRFKVLTDSLSKLDTCLSNEGDLFSFCMVEIADAALVSIGGFEISHVPRVGSEVDLRGKTFFRGYELQSPSNLDCVTTTLSVLILVLNPEEIYLTKIKKGEMNKCIVFNVIPLRDIIASATERAILHIAIRKPESNQQTINHEDINKNGKLTIHFKTCDTSLMVRECLDKYCSAFWKKQSKEIEDMLENCSKTGANVEVDGDRTWSEFQQA